MARNLPIQPPLEVDVSSKICLPNWPPTLTYWSHRRLLEVKRILLPGNRENDQAIQISFINANLLHAELVRPATYPLSALASETTGTCSFISFMNSHP